MPTVKKLLLAVCLLISISACGKNSKPKTDGKDVPTGVSTTKKQLNWLIETASVNRVDPGIFDVLNRLLEEKGYDFAIHPVAVDMVSGTAYTKMLKKRMENGEKTDIICTGYYLGNINWVGMYQAAVENDLLLPLDSFLQGEKGKNLREAYPETAFEMMRRNGSIYGLSFLHFGDQFYSAALNKERLDRYGIQAPETYSFSNYLATLLEMKKKADEAGEMLYAPEIELKAVCTELGYFAYQDFWLKEGEDGKIVFANPYEDPKVIERLEEIRCFWEKWNPEDGEVSRWNKEDNANASGYYMLLAPEMSYGNKSAYFPAYTYEAERKLWTYRIEDDDIGIASWTEYPEEAFTFLSLLATDADIANLLYYGVKGIVYDVVDGYAIPLERNDNKGKGFEGNSYVNKSIIYPHSCEPLDKKVIYRKRMEWYSVYPEKLEKPYRWVMTSEEETIAAVFKKAVGLWEGKYPDPKQYAEQICEELRKVGAYEVFESKSRQLYEEKDE